MNLRHLRYFVALAERLNFTLAARHLGIAQPPLSVQIRALEAEMGGALFDRERRKIRLTPLGVLLLDEARELLRQADRAADRMRDAAEGRAGELRVAYTDGAMSEKVTKRIRKFLKKHRGVRLSTARWSYDETRRPPADALITEATVLADGAVPLESAHVQVVLPPKHRLADRSEISLSDVIGETLILSPFQLRSPLEKWFTEAIDEQGLKVNVIEGPEQLSDRLWQVSLGLGIGLGIRTHRHGLDAIRVDLSGRQEVYIQCLPHAASRALALPAFLEAIRGNSTPSLEPDAQQADIGGGHSADS